MVRRKKLTVVYERDGNGWLASVPDVQGCHASGRSLAEAASHVREALATCVDVFGKAADEVARDVELVDDVRLPAAAKSLLRAALDARAKAEAQAAKAQAASSRAAKKLTADLGISVRDAGHLLGLSHERARRLATSDE